MIEMEQCHHWLGQDFPADNPIVRWTVDTVTGLS